MKTTIRCRAVTKSGKRCSRQATDGYMCCYQHAELMDFGSLRVFICYKREDDKHNTWVEMLASRLREAGINVALDVWEVRLGDSFTSYMTRRINEADVILFVITPASVAAVESGNNAGGAVKFELQLATAKRTSGDKVRVIGIYRSGQKKPAHLRDYRYADFRDDSRFDSSVQDLIEDIAQHNVASEWVPPHIQLLINQLDVNTAFGAEVASNAARQLGEFEHLAAVPHLFEKLDPKYLPTPMDEDWKEIHLFWDHHSDYLLNDAPVWFYHDLFEALLRIGKRAVPILIRYIDASEEHVRYKAANILGWIQDPSAVPALKRRIHDPSNAVISESCFALGKIGSRSAVKFLLKEMKIEKADRDEEDYALWGLTHNRFTVMPRLIEELSGPDKKICEKAKFTLVDIGDIAAPCLLSAAFERPDKAKPELAEVLWEILHHDSPRDVRTDSARRKVSWESLAEEVAIMLKNYDGQDHDIRRRLAKLKPYLHILSKHCIGEIQSISEYLVGRAL